MDIDLNYKQEDGSRDFGDLKLYGLTTCGFCRQAITFLRDNSIKFKYIYVDELEPETKFKLKGELEKKYRLHVSYPLLTIDDENTIIGFFKSEWETKFSD